MLKKLMRSEASWSLLDQGGVSAGNFLTTLVLARTLSRAEYGSFSLLFLALFAINTCHSSLVVYPLTLLGAKMNELDLRALLGVSVVQSCFYAVPLALVLSIAALALHQAYVLPGLIAAMIAWQLQETARRGLLAHLRSRAAIGPDLLSYLGQGLLLLLFRPKSLNVIFFLMAGTSVVSATLQLLIARVRWPRALSRRDFAAAWRFGRISLAGNVLNMTTLQIPSWTLEFFAGRAAVAGYQSLLNLAGVANPIIFSVSNLLIPAIARGSQDSIREARSIMLRYGARYGLLLLPCFLGLAIAPKFAMSLVYGSSSPYVALSSLLRVFVFAFVFQYLATVIGAYEGGMSRPESYMWVQVAGTVLLLTAGIFFIYRYGIAGAIYAMLAASALRLVAFVLLSHVADRKLTLSSPESSLSAAKRLASHE